MVQARGLSRVWQISSFEQGRSRKWINIVANKVQMPGNRAVKTFPSRISLMVGIFVLMC